MVKRNKMNAANEMKYKASQFLIIFNIFKAFYKNN